MGSYKTSWAIQEMQKESEYNYLYITPYLDEIKRVKEACTNRKFYEPGNEDEGREIQNTKKKDLHYLLANNKDIISTHALFKSANDVTRELIKAGNYILILDEVVDVVKQYGQIKDNKNKISKKRLGKDDIKDMLDLNLITIDDENFVIWNKEKQDYDGRYNDIKSLARNHSLFVVNNTNMLLWTFPIDIFKNFKEVYVLTYMFEGQIQKYYFDKYKLEYEYYYTDYTDKNNLNIIKGKSKADKSNIKDKIHILENDKINNIGDNDFSLSYGWYQKNKDNELVNILRKHMANYFRNKIKAPDTLVLWTTFKEYQQKIGGRYKNKFVPINIRATNNYKDKIYLAYLVNRFMNPVIKLFFTQNDIEVNEDVYALSEMIQWIWRSGIRENEEIWIYMPSKRERDLLIYWLNN